MIGLFSFSLRDGQLRANENETRHVSLSSWMIMIITRTKWRNGCDSNNPKELDAFIKLLHWEGNVCFFLTTDVIRVECFVYRERVTTDIHHDSMINRLHLSLFTSVMVIFTSGRKETRGQSHHFQ